MTARIKIPVPEVVKAVQAAKKRAEVAHRRRLTKWTSDYRRWSKAALRALESKAVELGNAISQSDDEVYNLYGDKQRNSNLGVTVPAEWPGHRPELDPLYDRDLAFLKATDATHISIDPDDRLDRFGRHFV